jgi:hypothetical protein
MYTPQCRVFVRGALAAVLVTVSASCATAGQGQPKWEGTPRAENQNITVVVENLIWNDVVIYSEAYGSRVRLGTVTTGMTSSFRIPKQQRFSPELELIADPIGSAYPYRSGTIVAAVGQEVRWTVHQNAGVRQLTIW